MSPHPGPCRHSATRHIMVHCDASHHGALRRVTSWCIATRHIMVHCDASHHGALRRVTSWCIATRSECTFFECAGVPACSSCKKAIHSWILLGVRDSSCRTQPVTARRDFEYGSSLTERPAHEPCSFCVRVQSEKANPCERRRSGSVSKHRRRRNGECSDRAWPKSLPMWSSNLHYREVASSSERSKTQINYIIVSHFAIIP